MIELARHIELLLLSKDCVIIPDFGGFVTHYCPARWNPEDHCYLPPSRTIGFNPQLKMNDGLLVQSFMTAYNTSFSDATRIVAGKAGELTDHLQRSGKAELGQVGELSYGIDGTYLFRPFEYPLLTPALYGLSGFTIHELTDIPQPAIHRSHGPAVSSSGKTIRLVPRYIREAAAVAAAIILSFFLSTPAENTYVESGNYARLFPGNRVETAISESLAHILVGNEQPHTQQRNPITVKEVKVTAEVPVPAHTPAVVIREETAIGITTPQPDTPVAPGNSTGTYKIIVGSMSTERDAEKLVLELTGKGYPHASVVKGDGRIRVSIMAFDTREEANRHLVPLREEPEYENAWLLITR